MRAIHRDIFLLIGVVAVVAMLCTINMSWTDVLMHIRRAGIWLPAVIVLWLPIYMMNARAWQIILNDGGESVGFWRMLKYTISGYALNYVTPVGLLGGEPYRIIELSEYVGSTKATSSVILYSMTHIFSHFCFWSFGVILFVVLYFSSLNAFVVGVLVLIALFCSLGIYFFMQGYRNGLAMRALRLLGHLPFFGSRVRQFADSHVEAIRNVDAQISALHAQRRSTFYISLCLEIGARMLGCVEIMFILFVFTRDVSYWNCVLVQAFSSLFANIIFFVPMQMGTREGGLALIADNLHIRSAYGVLTGLLMRVRELVWISIGLLLIKVGNKIGK